MQPDSRIRPNLVYLFADQLRYHACGFAGDPWAQTSNIDSLAKQGVDFTNATSCTPVCAAHRASLFTGKYQSSHGMVINELRLSPEHRCFGHVLTQNGYDTAYIGKWHLWANELGNHRAVRNGFVPPGPYRLGFDGYWAGYNFNHNSYDAYYFENTCDPIPYQGYEADIQTEMALDYIQQAAVKDNPFSLFLSWGPPHDPWGADNTPAEYWEMFQETDIQPRPNFSAQPDPYADQWGQLDDQYLSNLQSSMRGYYAQTANIDWNLGRVMDCLDRLGLAESTILVFTSDHGEMFGSQGRRAKNIFYDEACHVPFLLRQSGRTPAGSTTEVCLNTVDIMPTLLSMMDLPVPTTVEGVDLSHWVEGRSGPEPTAAFMQGMGTTAAWVDGSEWRGLKDRQFTYAIYRRDREELLFDNLADPYQTRNLVEDANWASTLRHYREMLLGWMQSQNDTFEACTWYQDQWMNNRNIMQGAKGGTHDLPLLQEIIQTHFHEADRILG